MNEACLILQFFCIIQQEANLVLAPNVMTKNQFSVLVPSLTAHDISVGW